MDYIELIATFLVENNIKEEAFQNALSKLQTVQIAQNNVVEYQDGVAVIVKILTDTYRLNAQNVKKCAEKIAQEYGPIGRYEKDLIKSFLDYNNEQTFVLLSKSLQIFEISDQKLKDILSAFTEDHSLAARESFITNWQKADEFSDETKKYDYLNGLYTRLLAYFDLNLSSLEEIFNYNKKFIEKELDTSSINELKTKCFPSHKIDIATARKEFSKHYLNVLKNNLQKKSNQNDLEFIMNRIFAEKTPFSVFETEQFGLVIINLNQKLYDNFLDFESFMDTVLAMLEQTYRVLENHKSLVIKIDNIFTKESKNIKWQLYSYLGIFAEHFIPTLEKRNFYKPEELCIANGQYLIGPLSEEIKSAIKSYYAGKCSKTELQNQLGSNIKVDDLVLDFENVWYGYTFSDCLSLITGDNRQEQELSFIKNNNQISLVFYKYRHDDRKIPCPECAGLDISGNSFPEVGLRSWECKNAFCPSRSKSNRGKRYSNKSNFMQQGFEAGVDLISKDLIKKWRRDIISVEKIIEFYDMVIQYFSFSTDHVLLINADSEIVNNYRKRKISIIDFEHLLKMQHKKGYFSDYFKSGKYVRRYLVDTNTSNEEIEELDYSNKIKNSKKSILAWGDSQEVLKKIKQNTFSAAVTSPPYYNARAYSQWSNLYLYLSDMYKITKEIYRTLKPGGVYLYNIGDICGNENTVVRSNMGNKRIILGAYTIHLFLTAGFELIDNLLWDKGEPQSNRQKNDGKFTPFYQKPMNVYEHMFIFKKPGAPIITSSEKQKILSPEWRTNIVPFTPVIKINSKGENMLGHTAPFPEAIPDFVAKVFTKCDDDLILEPFTGSGTSIIAAAKNSKRCFGIELQKDYVALISNLCSEHKIDLEIL